MICYRHTDPRLPFLVERTDQAPARWHDAGEGPVQYLSDTPDAAWAEFLRHEEIASVEDLATVRRAMWAVDLPDEDYAAPRISNAVLTGGLASYAACREEARRIRRRVSRSLRLASGCPSAPAATARFVCRGSPVSGRRR